MERSSAFRKHRFAEDTPESLGSFKVRPNKRQQFFRKIAQQCDLLKIGWTIDLLHEQAIFIEPPWKRSSEEIPPGAQHVYGLANPWLREFQPHLKDQNMLIPSF